MTVVSQNEERVVRQLVRFAGNPVILEEALDALRQELPEPPTIEQLLEKILELRVEHKLGRPSQGIAAG